MFTSQQEARASRLLQWLNTHGALPISISSLLQPSTLVTGMVVVAGLAVAAAAVEAVVEAAISNKAAQVEVSGAAAWSAAAAAAVAGAGAVAGASAGVAAASSAMSVGGEGWGGVPAGGWLGTSSMLKSLDSLLVISTNEGRMCGSLRRQLSARLLYSGSAKRGKCGNSVLGMSTPALNTYGCCPV